MRIRRRRATTGALQHAAFRKGAFADLSDFNPWLLPLRHMDPLSSAYQRIAFQTSEVRHANRHLDPLRGIGEQFLAGTRLHPHRPEWDASALEYFSSVLGPVIARSGSETIDDIGEPLSLPDPTPLELPLGAVLERRRSVREFSGDPIPLADIATIVHAAAGITHQSVGVAIDRPIRYTVHFRAVPSAGGLYAVDTYCLLFEARGLTAGVYRYRAFEHTLARLDVEGDANKLRSAFMQSEVAGVDLGRVAAALVFVGSPSKLTRKYGDRGVRYLFIEAGMMALSANLAASALGWAVLDYQSFYEPKVEQCLRLLRGRQQYALHALLIGWPLSSPDDHTKRDYG